MAQDAVGKAGKIGLPQRGGVLFVSSSKAFVLVSRKNFKRKAFVSLVKLWIILGFKLCN